MRKNKKIFGIIACSAVLAGAVTVGAANINVAPAAAEDETTAVTFEVAQEAQVNYEQAAIRFAATVSADYLATLGTTVKLVSSIDKMGGSDVAQTAEWVLKGDGATYVAGYATNTYYHSITFFGDKVDAEVEEQTKAAAAVDLTATMWLESDGVEVEGSRQSVIRSMRNVANTVYDQVDSDKQSDLKAYFGTRYTAKNAFKEVGESFLTTTTYGEYYQAAHWVVDGSSMSGDKVADAVYKNNELVGADLAVGTTDAGNYALWVGNDVYNVPSVTYVTNAIENVEEFAPFLTKGANHTGGYYALVTDMGSWSSPRAGKNMSTAIFGTTLDGNGHDIYVKPHSYGLFGTPAQGATVKNLGIHVTGFNKTPTAQSTGSFLFFDYVSTAYTNRAVASVTVENIYVDFAEGLTLQYANLIGNVDTSKSQEFKIKDVIINLGDNWSTVEDKNSALIFKYWNQSNAGWSDSVPTLENVNVITSAQAIARSDGNVVCYAQNDKALRDADTTNSLSGNYKYELTPDDDEANEVEVGKSGLFGWHYVEAEEGDEDVITDSADKAWKFVELDRRVLYRYDNLAAMAADANAQLVGNWKVEIAEGETEYSVSWVNSGN